MYQHLACISNCENPFFKNDTSAIIIFIHYAALAFPINLDNPRIPTLESLPDREVSSTFIDISSILIGSFIPVKLISGIPVIKYDILESKNILKLPAVEDDQ